MQHQEAIRVIKDLKSELTKEAAESVLLRYAREEDLAPAQLEKLAQTYNIVRQLSHIDASEDRGSSCHQIDTPELLRSYTVGNTKAAAAAVTVERATHDAGSVDLMRALRSEMEPVVKAASCDCDVADDAITVTRPSVPAPSPEANVLYTIAQVKDAAWEAKVDFYLIADEVLKMAKCEGRTLQIAQAELDASRQANPVCVSEALNWLEKYAGQQKLSRQLSRHQGPIKPAAFNFNSPLSDKIVELAEAFVVTSLFHKAAAELGIPIGELPQSDSIGGDSATADVMDMLEQMPVDVPDEEVPMKFDETEPERVRPSSNSSEGSSEESGGGKGGKSGKGGGDKDAKPTDQKGSHWLAAIISGATRPAAALAKTVDSAATGAKGAVAAVTGKERVHKDQVRLDGDIADIRRSILIRRLAASDPVLREMPLSQVLETYNAIAESSPEVASNPRRVLLAMREAASYEGVTADSQKLLGDIRSTSAKTDQQETENSKRRYTA